MIGQGGAAGGGRTVRAAVVTCVVVAAAILAWGLLAGQGATALALAAGLLLGSVNGILAQRSLGAGSSFAATSMMRLGVLTVAGLAIGLVLGGSRIWLVILALGCAQLILAMTAAREALGR